MFEILAQDWLIFAALLVGAALVAGFLAGLFGIGGGAVMVPVFSEVYVWGGTDPIVAQFVAVGTSLAVIVPTSLRSARAHLAAGNVERQVVRAYLWFVPLGVVGALAFATLDWVKGTQALRLTFGVMAALIAAYMLLQAKEVRWRHTGPTPALTQIGATVIGFLSVLMGIGGGLMNNLFMMVQGTPIKRAIGTSAAVGTLISVPGALGFVWIGWGAAGLPPFTWGYVNWLTVLLVIPITVLMAPVGARLTQRLPTALTSRLFGAFLLLVGTRMLWTVWTS